MLKEGRFGPYVTDGETNASLRRDDDPETDDATSARSSSSPTGVREGPAKKRPARGRRAS